METNDDKTLIDYSSFIASVMEYTYNILNQVEEEDCE